MSVPTKEQAKQARDRAWFGGNREIAIQRDGEQCVKCGMTREQHRHKYGRDITVDHIDRNGNGVPKHLKNNALTNLQTLCLSCHAAKDNPIKKLTDEQVINIRHCIGSATAVELAKIYGITPRHARAIMRGYTKKNLLPDAETWSRIREIAYRANPNLKFITHNGKTQTLSEWSREVGVGWGTIITRLRKGYSIEKALATTSFRNGEDIRIDNPTPRKKIQVGELLEKEKV